MALNDLVVEKEDCLPSNGGTLTGPLILNADPTSNLQAATKQYVDNKISGGQFVYLPKSRFSITNGTVSNAYGMAYITSDFIYITGYVSGTNPTVYPIQISVPELINNKTSATAAGFNGYWYGLPELENTATGKTTATFFEVRNTTININVSSWPGNIGFSGFIGIKNKT